MYVEKRGPGLLKIFLVALVTSLLTLTAYALLLNRTTNNLTGKQSTADSVNRGNSSSLLTNTSSPLASKASITGDLSQLYSEAAIRVSSKALPAVVGITTEKTTDNTLFGKEKRVEGFGSGVLVSSNGLILTNQHVAGDKGNKTVVSLMGGNNTDGVTIWSDPMLDMAVVKINKTGLKYLPLGNANTLKVGQPAIAIGNPLGLQLQRTVTSGIISALNRTIQVGAEDNNQAFMEDLIQTDASINPGNSGGPLIDLNGNVVGINTVKVSSAEGLGFAIPVNVATPVIRQLSAKGSFDEPYMGVYAYDKELVPYVKNNFSVKNGVVVVKVDTQSPAYKAGIGEGAVITAIDGKNVDTMLQLRESIYSKLPGDEILVTSKDADGSKSHKIVLTRRTIATSLTR